VSRQMLSRYAHIRAQAKRAAIASLNPAAQETKTRESEEDSPQKSPQSERDSISLSFVNPGKLLN